MSQLISFSNLSNEQYQPTFIPKFLLKHSLIKVAFDGSVYHSHENQISSFQFKEETDDLADFVNFLESLEQSNLSQFVSNKISNSSDEREKRIWEIINFSLAPDTFRENLLNHLNVKPEEINFSLLDEPSSDLFQDNGGDEGLFGRPKDNFKDDVFQNENSNEIDFSFALTNENYPS